jgi:hypothetical protein
VILGRPETPPPVTGWWAHLAPTVDIIPANATPLQAMDTSDLAQDLVLEGLVIEGKQS